MSWLHTLTKQEKKVSRMGLIPAYMNFMKFGGENDIEAGLPEIWKVNGEQNIKWLDEHKIIKTVYNLPSYEGKSIVFCGLGPSMNDQWEALKDLDDRFIIVATNSSAQFLLEKDIKPHYVIAIDGRTGNWTLDLGEKCKDVTGIFSACVAPKALQEWPGEIMIVPYGVDDKSLNGKIKRRFGKGVPSGGNSFNNAVIIFQLFTKAKVFIFCGHDLSFKDNYYADRPSNNDESTYFFATDVKGERVKTLIPLYEYKIWLESLMAQLIPEYYFFNCSEGILGVDVDGSLLPFITHTTLSEAIKETKNALDIEILPLDKKLKYMYDEFYNHNLGNIHRGVGIWRFITKYYGDFKKAIDVGCGRANGVQYSRNKGFDVYGCDISEGAIKCWEERGVAEYCKVAPANKLSYEDNEFEMVVCSEVLEHIPEEDTIDSLKEIFRIGSDKYFFTIALKPETIPLGGFIQTHINIHPAEWWFQKFGEVGYKIIAASHSPSMFGISIMAVKDEGLYLRKEKSLPLDENGNPIIVVIGALDEPGESIFMDDNEEVML